MKYKKLILALSLFIIFFTYIVHPAIEEGTKRGFKDEIIRFHIRANSDKEEDQALKLKIRDEILEAMKDKFKGIKSIKESREVIENNMEEMKSITERVIEEEGKDYKVGITLGQDNFPTRKYGNLVLPTGEYETLLITLGEGKGQNWWCVMFPPLCFVDITHSVAYNLEKELGVTEMGEEQPELKLKWKTAEVLKKFKNDDKKELTVNKEEKMNKVNKNKQTINLQWLY